MTEHSGIVTNDSGQGRKSVTFKQNGRSRSVGTTGHVQSESTVNLVRNTHEVLEVTPPSRLAYRWNASGEQAAMGLKTTVTWTLVPVEGGTRVRMEHAGFRPEDENGCRGMGGGWPGIVDRLGVLARDLAESLQSIADVSVPKRVRRHA